MRDLEPVARQIAQVHRFAARERLGEALADLRRGGCRRAAARLDDGQAQQCRIALRALMHDARRRQ